MTLIKNVEKNLKDFQVVFKTIPRNPIQNPIFRDHELKNFFSNLTAIEEDILEMRLKKIVEREHPYLPAIRLESLKNMGNYYQSSLLDLIKAYLRQKEKLLDFINKIPLYYWERTGVHELEGHVSFEEFIRRLIKNDKNNLHILKMKFNN
jgi:predicted CopG family antitoxin